MSYHIVPGDTGIHLSSESRVSVTVAEHRITQTDSDVSPEVKTLLSKDLATPLGMYKELGTGIQTCTIIFITALVTRPERPQQLEDFSLLKKKHNKQYAVLYIIHDKYYVHSYISNRSRRVKRIGEMVSG